MTNDYNNDKGFRFRKWDIYQDALKFRKMVNDILKNFPKEETYALTDQAKRALNSIVLNIAEGANKGTDRDTRLYINHSHGSLDEVVACMDCALDDRYITKEQHLEIGTQAESLAKRLRKFAVHLSGSSSS